MKRAVVIGIDSSTQSTKALAVDLDTGEEIGEGRAAHSGENIQDPRDWWAALGSAVREAVTPEMDVRGLAVNGQQHGLVTLDTRGDIVRPAPLWNNTDAAPDAERLNGLADFPAEIGTRLVASITIAKLAHLARTASDDLARTAKVCLPHDYLNFRLTGRIATDRGDASGSGWWSPATGRIRRDLLALAIGSDAANRLSLPDVCGPEEIAGTLTAAAAAELGLTQGIPVGPGSGDNPGAAVGVGATADELVISLGTSGTAYAVSDHPTRDATGEVAGFADATGKFLPLACMLNCTRVVDAIAHLLGVDLVEALDRAGAMEPGADGMLLVPYLSGERTPNLPFATGSLLGLTDDRLTPDTLLRAAIDGVAAGLAYCVDALARLDVAAPEIVLVGGGSRHRPWQQAIADATGLPVTVRGGREHCARGAAIQIAAIIRGERVRDLAASWRPAIMAQVDARPGMRAAFRLEERRQLIAQALTDQPPLAAVSS